MAHGPGLTIAIAEKRFAAGDTPLFADFQLDIAPGSVVALHGPSGIGKSTLLRLVAGIDHAFAGTIAVAGLPARDAPPPGFVFQDPRLLPWLTAGDNIRAADPTITLQAAETLLARLGLAGSANLYPRALSGGMQRRVALARALATHPRLLLLDEPFVSLDRILVDEMHGLVADVIAESRPTLLFASHLPSDAARLADRVIVLAGRPARIVRDLAFPIPRLARDSAALADYARQLDRAGDQDT